MCWIGIVHLLWMDIGPGCYATGLENVQIGAAPTEIAGNRTPQLGFRGRRRFVQQAFEAHDLTRRTEAALKGIGIDKGLLHRVEFTMLSNTFNGGNGVAFTVNGQAQTGIDGTAVEENGAGATVPHIANFFGARQGEVIAQGIEQGAPRFQHECVLPSVDL
jgi:hypothetical protein